jgi:hypothetical protein
MEKPTTLPVRDGGDIVYGGIPMESMPVFDEKTVGKTLTDGTTK